MFDIQDPAWLDRVMRDRKIETGALASESGVSRSQIQRIRNGMSPRLDTLRSLTAALDRMTQQAAA